MAKNTPLFMQIIRKSNNNRAIILLLQKITKINNIFYWSKIPKMIQKII